MLTNYPESWTKEQKEAYAAIKAIEKRIARSHTFIPRSNVLGCVDVPNQNHPSFIPNDLELERQAAWAHWWKIQPEALKYRLSAIRGDYGRSDSWETPKERVKDVVSLMRSGE
jgi:hypothetical protein